MLVTHKPGRCVLCGHFLTAAKEFAADCCIDPTHWLAAGLVAPKDFYKMAWVTALARERKQQSGLRITRLH